jgi:CysZ protein
MMTNRSILGPMASAACLLRGLKMLFLPGLRRFLWVPLLINLLLYSLGFWLAAHYFTAAMNWLLPAWLGWLHWLLWPLFAALLSALAFFSFTVVANLIGSPFYGFLAEKALAMTGLSLPGEVAREKSLWEEIAESLASESKRLTYFATRALPLLVLSIIPVVNMVAAIGWLLFGAWSLALEYMAYPLEARGMPFPQQRELAKTRRLDVLAFGGMAMLGLSVPILNVLVPPAAVIGATLYLSDLEKKRRTGQNPPSP